MKIVKCIKQQSFTRLLANVEVLVVHPTTLQLGAPQRFPFDILLRIYNSYLCNFLLLKFAPVDNSLVKHRERNIINKYFLAHLALWAIAITFRPSSVVRSSTFHILIFSSETTGQIATKLWWNGPWMASFQICVRWSRLPTKMAAKLKIAKRGDDILIVHCCFSISQNEIKYYLQLHGKE